MLLALFLSLVLAAVAPQLAMAFQPQSLSKLLVYESNAPPFNKNDVVAAGHGIACDRYQVLSDDSHPNILTTSLQSVPPNVSSAIGRLNARIIYRAGWPFRSHSGYWIEPLGESYRNDPVTLNPKLFIPITLYGGVPHTGLLLDVYITNFFINTMLYTILLALLLCFGSSARRHAFRQQVRQASGRCVGCGYAIDGRTCTRTCPECGARTEINSIKTDTTT